MTDRELIVALVKCIEELMPGIGHVVCDIGHLNDTLIAARQRLQKEED